MVEIRDDQVMPPTERRGREAVYPWRTMFVGQSFTYRPHVTWGSAKVLASRMNDTLHPKIFRVRNVDGAFIVWRVR